MSIQLATFKTENDELLKERLDKKKEYRRLEEIKAQLAAKKKLYDSLAAAEIQTLKKAVEEVTKERDALDQSNSELTLERTRLQHELEKSREQARESPEEAALSEVATARGREA